MTELERVQRKTYRRLVKEGFTQECAQEIANSFVKVVEYWKGKPSVVLTEDGHRVYI